MVDGTIAMSNTFARRLKRLRQEAGMSQEDVARKAGVSLSTIVKLEAGNVEPTWATVRAIAKAIGVSVVKFEEEDTSEPDEPTAPKKPPKKPKK